MKLFQLSRKDPDNIEVIAYGLLTVLILTTLLAFPGSIFVLRSEDCRLSTVQAPPSYCTNRVTITLGNTVSICACQRHDAFRQRHDAFRQHICYASSGKYPGLRKLCKILDVQPSTIMVHGNSHGLTQVTGHNHMCIT